MYVSISQHLGASSEHKVTHEVKSEACNPLGEVRLAAFCVDQPFGELCYTLGNHGLIFFQSGGVEGTGPRAAALGMFNRVSHSN